MPYFICSILELPVAPTRDYALFNILNEHSTELRQRLIDLSMETAKTERLRIMGS